MSEHTPLTEAERESLSNVLTDYAYGHHDEKVYAEVNRILAARTSTATADTGHLVVTRWGHARWFDPHPPRVVNVRLRADGDTGAHPLMADCATCHEVLLPVTFAATADTGLRERVEAKMRDCLRLSGTAVDPEVREWTAAFGKDLKAILDATAAVTEDIRLWAVQHPDPQNAQIGDRVTVTPATPASTEGRADNEGTR